MKTILITGATSGIGKATAGLLATQENTLVLCGRRAERLQELSDALSSKTRVHTLCFDVRDRNQVLEQINSLPEDLKQIDVLINNAGNAHGLDFIQDGSLDDWDAMMDGNVKGLLYVTKAVLPGMIAARQGHIINIGSIAAKEVYPRGNVYCASKHAVDALTSAMRQDLLEYGIKVSAIHPGLVNTEFSTVRFKGDTDRADAVYQGMTPLVADDIAEIIAFAISRPRHVNLADLLVLPLDQAGATLVKRKE